MQNRHIIFIHILIALVASVVFYINTKPLSIVPETILLTDAITVGFTLSILFFVLKKIFLYGHFYSLIFRQKIINYSALGILFIGCWIGIEYIVLYLSFSPEQWYPMTLLLPTRITIASLSYCIVAIMHEKNANDNTEQITDGDDFNEYEILPLNDDSQISNLKETIERIAVKNGQKIDVILVSEIICILAEGDYVMIHTEKGKFLKEQTMKSLENSLPGDKFVRVHRSSIVNIEAIAQIELYNKQTQLLKLKNGIQVRVSLAGYKLLKIALGL